MIKRLVLACLLLAAPAARLGAQVVEVRGAEGTAAGTLAREIAARGQYVLIARDTILPKTFRAPGDLVVLDADVRLEGTVAGDVAVLGGDLFLRPGSRIGGRIALVGGDVYPSGLATYGDILDAPAARGVRAEPTPEGALVEALEPPPPPLVSLPGLFGVRAPTYDRVDGLTLGISALVRLVPRIPGPTLTPFVTLHTGRGDFGGGAELEVPLSDDVELSVLAARDTWTNEEWIRGDLANSLAAFFVGSDVRNYHESDLVSLQVERVGPLLPEVGRWAFAPRVGLRASRDRSLDVSTTWALLGEMDRPNPAIDPGTVASAYAGTAVAWRGLSASLEGTAEVEWAPGGVGDFDFLHARLGGTWQMLALRDHRLFVRGRGLVAIGGGAPRQRWSIVGGPGTLPTYGTGEFRGDRLVFFDTGYGIPLRRVQLPFVGMPELQLRYATGVAWASGESMPDWGQNLGAGLRFSFVGVEVWVDPAGDELDPTLDAYLSIPGF